MPIFVVSFPDLHTHTHTHLIFINLLGSLSVMKFVKSILGPVRVSRDLSFLSRRNKGSFLGRKATGGGFESHEPSSPKVTCIGQVRVKSKRKARQCRYLSRRGSSSGSGEVSFRKGEGEYDSRLHRNQRWAHLAVPVRELLSCKFPCSCCCWRGCGTGFCRWLLCAGDGGKREIEVERMCGRNHVFENIEVRDGRIHQVKGEAEEENTEAARVRITIPPKNALLLMRCRSDPMKMAALANRITWAAPPNYEEQQEDEGQHHQTNNQDEILEEETKEEDDDRIVEEKNITEESGTLGQEEKEDVESNMSSFEALLDHDNNTDHYDSNQHNTPEEESESLKPTATISTAQDDNPNPLNKTEQCNDIDQQDEPPILPKCLLLMMCEPKLSKETWVHYLPPRKPARLAKTACCHHNPDLNRKTPPPGVAAAEPQPGKPVGLPKKSDLQQPARSSCSLLADHKLSNGAAAYEPLVLTRCKSEPMRTADAGALFPEGHIPENGGAPPGHRRAMRHSREGVPGLVDYASCNDQRLALP